MAHVGHDVRDEELDWLTAHGDELAAKYAGKWVAIDGPGVVAVADDLVPLLEQAHAGGRRHPLVTQIPLEPIGNLVAPAP